MDNRIKEKMKKGLAMVMTICMVLTMVGIVPGEAKADEPVTYEGADQVDDNNPWGTERHPWQIKTKEQLKKFAQDVNSGEVAINSPYNHFVLVGDIDLGNEEWTPIGTSNEFTGAFDGNSKKISGLKISSENSSQCFGLFGKVAGDSLIEKLTVEGSIDVPSGTGNTCYAGLIAAKAEGKTIVRDCKGRGYVKYTGTESAYLGGIVGYDATTEAEISECNNYAEIDNSGTGSQILAGGIVAKFSGKEVKKCVNEGKVTGYYAGGIVGQADACKITGCTNKGQIVGNVVGGIVGSKTASGNVIWCVNEGVLKGNTAGGIVGIKSGSDGISNCTNKGDITQTADATVGGIVGKDEGDGIITVCENTGNIVGNAAGGIVGNKTADKDISVCKNAGSVTGRTAGGIAGAAISHITGSKNTGTITAASINCAVGGIAGSCKYIFQCSNSGKIVGKDTDPTDSHKTGGIVGEMDSSAGRIRQCSNTGDVTFGAGISGSKAPYIQDCYNVGETDMGGIAMQLENSNIMFCYSAENKTVELVKVGSNSRGMEPLNCFYWNTKDDESAPWSEQNWQSGRTVPALGKTKFANQEIFEKAGWDFATVWTMADASKTKDPKVRPMLQWESPTENKKKDVTSELIMQSWTKGETASEPVLTNESNGYDKVFYYLPWKHYLKYMEKGADGRFKDREPNVAPSEPGEYKLEIRFERTETYKAKTLETYFTIYSEKEKQKNGLDPLVIAVEQPSWMEGEEAKKPIITGDDIDPWAKEHFETHYKPYVTGVTNVFNETGYTRTAPKSAGKYVVRISISAVGHYDKGTYYQIFEVKPREATVVNGRKQPSVYIDMQTAWYYGQTPATPLLKGDYDHSALQTWTYRDLTSGYSTTTMPINAGTYQLTVTLKETANYTAATVDKMFTIYSYQDLYGTGTSGSTVGYALPISNQSVTKVSSSVVGNTVEVATVSESTLNRISGNNSSYNSVLLDASGASVRVNRMAIDRSSLNEIYRLMDRKTHINNAVLRFTRGDLELTKNRLAKLLSENTGIKFEFSLSEDGASGLTRSQQSALTMGGIVSILEPRLKRVNENGSIKTYDSLNGKDMTVRYTYVLPVGKTVADYEIYGVGTDGRLRQYPLNYQGGRFQFDVQTEDVYVLVLKGATSGNVTNDPTIIEGGGIIEAASSSLALNSEFVVRHRGKSLKVGWGKVGNADCYEIYAARTNRDFDYSKPAKVVDGNKDNSQLLTYVGGKRVNPNYNYKVCVYACRNVNGQRVKVFQSLMGYVVGTKNKKYTNTRIMTIKQTHCFMEVGDTNRMGAKIYLMDKKKKLVPGYTSKFRYCSSNPEIVSVSKTGKLTAVSPGTCVVYVYAKNGVARKTTIKVS